MLRRIYTAMGVFRALSSKKKEREGSMGFVVLSKQLPHLHKEYWAGMIILSKI